ncbi:hypothetical protein FRC19_006729 [Serendipita sp. 401]|nr:hypothetical protein FRC19_006729 [Serendipita sp. 401]
MLSLRSLAVLAVATSTYAIGITKPVSSVVSFGDSYSDPNFSQWLTPGGGGYRIWPQYLGDYLRIPVHTYGMAGATCSQVFTRPTWPDVVHTQLDLFDGQKRNGTLGTLDPATTVYTLWIGTNDVGTGCLLTGDQVNDSTLVDVTACAVGVMRLLYDRGARNFLFQNMAPLQKSPMYKKDAYPGRYWSIPNNTTQVSLFMESEVKTGNAMGKMMLQDLAPSLKGAHLGIFDSYGLIDDIITYPARYLNGTAPFNITSSANACPYPPYGSTPLYCTVVTGTDVDSFVCEGDRLVKEVVLLGYSHGSIAITHHPVHVKFKGGSNIPVAHILLSYPLSPLPFLTTFHQGTHTEALKNLVSDRNSTVLIIYGTADQFTGEKRFQEWANGLKSQGKSVGIQVIEGADHFWHGNAMKTLLESVGAWLDSGERASSS